MKKLIWTAIVGSFGFGFFFLVSLFIGAGAERAALAGGIGAILSVVALYAISKSIREDTPFDDEE